MTGEMRDVRVVRMRLYRDKGLKATRKLQKTFRHTEHLVEYHVEQDRGEKKARKAYSYLMLVQWQGLNEEDNSTRESTLLSVD